MNLQTGTDAIGRRMRFNLDNVLWFEFDENGTTMVFQGERVTVREKLEYSAGTYWLVGKQEEESSDAS